MATEVTGHPGLAARIADALAGNERDAHVHVADLGAFDERPLAETDEAAWAARAEEPIWTAFRCFQKAYAEGARAIVAVVPSIALTGASGLAAEAAAAEGIRQLVKSAARAWGREGVRVNCVTLPVEEWGIVPPPERQVPNRYGPSLPGANDAEGIATAITALIDATAVTGATVGVDRGTVLAP